MKNFTPRFSTVLRSRLATSPSSIGRHSFRNSTTVTSQPKLLSMQANSMPITPAPTMQTRRGRAVAASIWSDVHTVALSSAPSIGSVLGTEPVAMMMLGAVYSSPSTSTVCASLHRASPLASVMPGAESSVSMPLRSVATMLSLREAARAKSKSAPSPSSPKSAPWRSVSIISALRAYALVGMQPRLRHVPPASARSAMTTFSPFLAACSAAR